MAAFAHVQKARKIKTASQDPVVQAADALQAKFSAAFEHAIAAVKSKVKLSDIKAALDSGNANAVADLLNIEEELSKALRGEGIAADLSSVKEVVEQVYRAGAEAAMSKLPVAIGTAISFDILNPESVEFLRNYELELIRELSTGTREAIRTILLQSFDDGIPTAQAARQIRDVIGLTQRQAAAVGNFQRALSQSTSESIRDALQRELRDHRFDATLRRALDQEILLTRDQIQQMTQRYYERYLKYRSRMIARTETIRASSAGQQSLWIQAEQQRLINRQAVQRRWVISGDERTCPICLGLNGEKTGLHEAFSDGSFYPPAHVSCRCGVVLDFSQK